MYNYRGGVYRWKTETSSLVELIEVGLREGLAKEVVYVAPVVELIPWEPWVADA